jgi:fluoride exporter
MHYALVFLGGGVGAALRHAVNLAAARLGFAFPIGTLAVNVLGCVLMGVLVAWFALRPGIDQQVKLLLTTGLLGGFTTFSAFSLDSALLWQRGAFAELALYAGGSVLLSVAGLFAGMAAVRVLA